MSEMRSSQPRKASPQRDSSVTQVRVELPADHASSAGGPDDQATVISARRSVHESSAPSAMLAPLEVGKLLAGEQLGKFELLQFIGGGGMGAVFRAWDTTLNREVAVKVLSRHQSDDDEALRRFRNEAQSAARLDHANIARVFYVGEDAGVNYIVFEFIEGTNLRDLVDRRGPLPLDEALDYTLQIAEALDHASQRDVIHRDIKPSNVLITAEGRAKLVDMGLARLHQVEHANDDLTASGVTLGTFDYISPEQARDPRTADVRSDLYSLGCSLYFMLVGQPPFPRGTVLQKLLQHQGDEPPNPRSLRSDLPAGVVTVVRRLLAKSPGHRYQRPLDLISDLQALQEGRGGPNTAVAPPAWSQPGPFSPRRWQKHLPWAVPLVALVIISLGLDFYWSRMDGAATLGAPSSLKHTPPVRDPSATDPSAAMVRPAAAPRPTESREPLKAPPPKTAPRDSAVKTPSTPKEKSDSISPATESAPEKTRTADSIPLLPAGEPRVEDSKSHPPPAIVPRARADGLLVVGDPGSGANYPTLEAACQAAKAGDVVELRFNGRRQEPPVVIANSKLTIRAGDGFMPVIQFAPREEPAGTGGVMITISGGGVSLMNVSIEFVVPREITAETWTLFEVREPAQLRLDKTSLTIRNAADQGMAFHPQVSFFAVLSSSAGGSGEVTEAHPHHDAVPQPTGGFAARESVALPDSASEASAAEAQAPASIELHNCIARGEATLMRVDGGASARVLWDNGLLATTDRLLIVKGSERREVRSRVEIDARHLTAEVRSGLAWLDFSDNGTDGMLADLRLAASIIRVGSGASFIEQRDPASSVNSEGTLSWSGDRNFYEAVDVFWKRIDATRTDSSQQLTFAGWQAFWGQSRETLPKLNAVVWQQSVQDNRPVSERTPFDFALSIASANNPARDSASDGLDAGCLANQLPALPAP